MHKTLFRCPDNNSRHKVATKKPNQLEAPQLSHNVIHAPSPNSTAEFIKPNKTCRNLTQKCEKWVCLQKQPHLETSSSFLCWEYITSLKQTVSTHVYVVSTEYLYGGKGILHNFFKKSFLLSISLVRTNLTCLGQKEQRTDNTIIIPLQISNAITKYSGHKELNETYLFLGVS